MSFVHLQVQSGYSLLDSAASVKDLAKKAALLEFDSIALTDFHVMYGAVEFYKECKKHGLKPILGVTASVFSGTEQTPFPLVLLAKTNTGYQNLLKISSVLQSKSKEGLKEAWLKSYSKDVIALTPGEKGYIERLLLNGKEREAEEAAIHLNSIFGNNHFYLSLQPYKTNERLSDLIVDLSEKTRIPIVASGDVHYLEKKDRFAYTCLKAIKNGEKISDYHDVDEQLHLKSSVEMSELYRAYPHALENTVRISEVCHVDLSLGQTKLPAYPLPEGKSADGYLKELCLAGIDQRKLNHSRYMKRLEYELEIISGMAFSDYFLIVWDFMKHAHEQGIATGPGRGSAAGSLVSYVLNITDVDPIEHDLLFERFLNPERISMPDIDIDFPDNRRDEVIQYVKEKYGVSHVAQIITFGTLAAKAALRDVGRVMGISPKQSDELAKMIPARPGITLDKARSESDRFDRTLMDSPLYERIFSIAKTIEGLPRHASTHAAGVVLSKEPLTNVVPVQDGHEGVYLTQYSMEHLEDLGLLKMDFLGLRNLTLIESIKRLIEKDKRIEIDFSQVPKSDEKTFELLAKGDTTGVFQLESTGMRSVLKRLKPTGFEDIVAVNALYRPGPMENIPVFIDRKHGKQSVDYPHPKLKEILKDTYGVIVYQEQIMRIASEMAGFKLGEADLLRRAVSKKQKSILDKEREHFVNGCLKKGYAESVAHEVYDLIVKFANYGFNRSHAVAYSMIGFQLAYLKAHFPLNFMAGLLTSVIGNEEKISNYLLEAKDKGLELLGPSVNHSEYAFKVENGKIRYSLKAIKNVGVAAVKEVFQERKKGRFTDLFDFCFRLSQSALNRKMLESLVLSGAMDEFGQNRATLLASLDVALEHTALFGDQGNQLGLFQEEMFAIKPKYTVMEEFPVIDLLNFEKSVLGFYFSSHPISPYREKLSASDASEIADLHKKGFKKAKAGVLLSKMKVIRTKNGQSMAFLQLSDETGELEAVIFPDQLREYNHVLIEGALVVAEGRMEFRNEKRQLIVSKAFPIENLSAGEHPSMYIKIEEHMHTNELLEKIKGVLIGNKGMTEVYIYYEKQKQTVKLHPMYNLNASHTALYRLKELVGDKNVIMKS
ncbi:DNA polymerase III subunit alpha [Bacillus gobiensis]|uniref:DNA polymerase III subunit alpha n=1 Tax=Bacillus gobiensis TaxID=1441095 RepID=UPI003D251630